MPLSQLCTAGSAYPKSGNENKLSQILFSKDRESQTIYFPAIIEKSTVKSNSTIQAWFHQGCAGFNSQVLTVLCF